MTTHPMLLEHLTFHPDEKTDGDTSTIGRTISQLIREIDTCYSQGSFGGVEELEAVLEEQLECLEAALSEIEEESGPWDQDQDPDTCEGCSIEEQFRAAYAQHLTDPHLFFPGDELAGHLRSVLEDSQVGGMSPADFKDAADEALERLAEELFREQRRRIAKLLSSRSSQK